MKLNLSASVSRLCSKLDFRAVNFWDLPNQVTSKVQWDLVSCVRYCLFSVYGWVRSQPMREDITCVMSSFIGQDLTQPQIENGLFARVNEIFDWRTRAHFLSLAGSKLRLCSANHRSDYAQPITGQVTEVTCPVIGQAQPELTPRKWAQYDHETFWTFGLFTVPEVLVQSFSWSKSSSRQTLWFSPHDPWVLSWPSSLLLSMGLQTRGIFNWLSLYEIKSWMSNYTCSNLGCTVKSLI